MSLPGPPSLKTTIIQLNKDTDPDDNNFEILSNEYNTTTGTNATTINTREEPPKKKRRRSTSLLDDDEIAKRRSETKQLHSIIEKRRRIKINREFEALKFIIPACRNSEGTSGTISKKSTGGAGSTLANNSNKIDGMYKLTILKSSVEYIMYLHHIIQKQHALLSTLAPDYDYDITYTQVPLNVNEYRNIDRDFVFSTQAEAQKQRPEPIREENEPDFSSSEQLPSPDITPEIAPILSLLNKYNGRPVESSSTTTAASSAQASPLETAMRTQFKRGSFVLPDPAISDSDNATISDADRYPRKMMFRTKVPFQNVTEHIDDQSTCNDKQRVEDATKALLTFRKPSIEKLLN